MDASSPSPLRALQRLLDIELTNRCNARCSFCPRDATPEQGFMSDAVFEQTIVRIKELDLMPEVSSAGQGDPLLHPRVVAFAQRMQEESIPYAITTNASRLTPTVAEGLHAAGLAKINFSVSDMGQDYAEVYALDFQNTLENIRRFLRLNEQRSQPCHIVLNIVEHDINKAKIESYKDFWRDQGITDFTVFKQNNRGGACENGGAFVDNARFADEARAILASRKISHLCSVPFINLFVAWNGNYYICCSDYEKTTPLGSVFEYSLYEMDRIKRERLLSDQVIDACSKCNVDPVNKVRETLFDIERRNASKTDLLRQLNEMQTGMFALHEWMRPLPISGEME